MRKTESQSNQAGFSVALGLFDYINPILYTITAVTLAIHMRGEMSPVCFAVFLLGAVLSIGFGLAIPTVKALVGLGRFEFKMPVNLVFFVNSGILLSGLALFCAVLRPGAGLLMLLVLSILGLLLSVYQSKKKFNTVAVLTGACGYLLIYVTMIYRCARTGHGASVALYAAAIALFVALCGIGIKANLKDARVHWVIEAGNVCCQACVALATVLAFR